MKTSKQTRIFSAFLAMVMVVLLIPVSVLPISAAADHYHPVCGTTCSCSQSHAGQTWQPFPSGTTTLTSGNYYLTSSINFTGFNELVIDGNVSICLNGYGIYKNSAYSVVSVESGTLTLSDCKGTGKISVTSSDSIGFGGGGALCLSDTGSLVMYGGTVNCDDFVAAIYCDTTGNLSIYNGTVTAYSSAIDIYNVNDVLIAAGTVTGTNESGVSCEYGTFHDITISGGYFQGKYHGVYFGKFTCNGEVTISGGEFYGKGPNPNTTSYAHWYHGLAFGDSNGGACDLIISGGTFRGVRGGFYNNNPLLNATISGGTLFCEENGHTWNDGVITTQPTCTTAGVKTYTCTVCGATKTETVPILDEIASGTWGDLSWKIDLDGALTISGTGTMGDFSSSSTDAWRAYKTSIKTVQIANGVTNIGNYAFYDCQNLKYAGIGNSVTSIGQGAFTMCTNLEAISNSTSLTHIGNSAFGYCYALRDITIPNGVTDIGSSAFSSCTNLTSITIPDSVTSIGDYAFNGCSALETVYYGGYKSQWNQISIGTNNTALTCATIVYAQCTGHIWNNGEITTEPTCTATGVKTYTCTECGATKTEKVAKKGHSNYTSETPFVYVDQSDSYYYLTHYHICGECGERVLHVDVFPDPTQGTVLHYVPPTHKSSGSLVYECFGCESYLEGWPSTLNGTCTFGEWSPYDETHHQHSCICGESELVEHTWNNGEITTAPTCTATGVKTYTCTGCGATKTEVVAATGSHTWNAGVITTEPTYTTEGVKTFTCTVCGATKTESVPVLEVTATSPQIVVSDKMVAAGGTVRVPISIENNPGVTMMGLTVNFDTDVLELIAVEDAELLKGPTFGNTLKSPYNMMWVDPLSTEDNTGNGTIVTLVFRAKEDAVLGDTDITVTYNPGNVCNADLDKVSFAVVNGKVTVADYVIGDVNADGDVSLADVTILCRYLAGWEEYQTINTVPGDVNSDGDVSLADVTILCRYLAGWEGVTLG